MKYIEIPEEVTLVNITNGKAMKDGDGDATMDFDEFVSNMLADKVFGSGMDNVFSALKIKNALDESNGILQLEDTDYDKLLAVLKSPSGGFDPRFAVSAVPFMEAIANAKKAKPADVPEVLKPEGKGRRRKKKTAELTVEADPEE